MPDKLSDRQVLLAILLTLVLVFGLVFSLHQSIENRTPPLLWRDSPPDNTGQTQTLQI